MKETWVRRISVVMASLCLMSGSVAMASEGDTRAVPDSVVIEIECAENLMFSRYDIDVFIDGEKIGMIDHGAADSFELDLPEGVHTLTIAKRGDETVDGTVKFSTPSSEPLSYKASCSKDQVSVEEVVEADEAAPLEVGTLGGDAVAISPLVFGEDTAEYVLDQVFSQQDAERAIIVAMTNAAATDVFAEDGNTYDPARFHAYDDIDGFHMRLIDRGTWTTPDDANWHVNGMTLRIEGPAESGDVYLRVTANVAFDGGCYVISGVTRSIGTLENLDDEDQSFVNVEQYEPSESTPFLTIDPGLIAGDRPGEGIGSVAEEQPTETIPATSEMSTDESVATAPEVPEQTIGQKNALKQAQSYLRFMPFSRAGLIEQLEFEGYSTEEAIYAVDACGADWNEQAAKQAESYIEFMAFSRDGLIEQLVFEGFSYDEATYGVTAVGY